MKKNEKINKFTSLLIEAREEKNLLKWQAASLFGWTPMYYGRFENGYLLPNKSNIAKFAEFIGISVEELEKIIKLDGEDVKLNEMES